MLNDIMGFTQLHPVRNPVGQKPYEVFFFLQKKIAKSEKEMEEEIKMKGTWKTFGQLHCIF